jgi:hypothetical protein
MSKNKNRSCFQNENNSDFYRNRITAIYRLRVDYSALIAPVGQTSSHEPQSMQVSGSMW